MVEHLSTVRVGAWSMKMWMKLTLRLGVLAAGRF